MTVPMMVMAEMIDDGGDDYDSSDGKHYYNAHVF